MQIILDEMQSDVGDELEKVSLERLADLNPNLLETLKRTAEENMRNNGGGSGGGAQRSKAGGKGPGGAASSSGRASPSSSSALPSFLVELRPRRVVDRSNAWDDLKGWDPDEKVKQITEKLRRLVKEGTDAGSAGGDGSNDDGDMRLYTQQEAIDMTQYLAAATAAAAMVEKALEQLKLQQQSSAATGALSKNAAVGSGSSTMAVLAIDKSLFTNEGIKQKNDTAIGQLYEMGLPFVSSSDGRRFASQLDLSRHLDALFKKNQLEKSMARTEERGWYADDTVWTCEVSEAEMKARTGTTGADGDAGGASTSGGAAANDDGYDPQTSTVPADETRERCVVCGLKFRMHFDDEEGMYRYGNCREIRVENDADVAEHEFDDVLCHVTCWRGLGSPDVLTSDQALQDTLRA